MYFIVNELNDPLPNPQPRRIVGKARAIISSEWIENLLDDPDFYIPTLQSMGYDVKSKSDLIEMAQSMEYYSLGGGYVMAK